MHLALKSITPWMAVFVLLAVSTSSDGGIVGYPKIDSTGLSSSVDPASTTCSLPDPMSYKPGPKGNLYEVGRGKKYASTHEVPLHQLKAGDLVRIYAKPDRAPYHEKLFIAGKGAANNPIIIVGIPDAQGNKPIFNGNNATMSTRWRKNLYWNKERQAILVGQYRNTAARNIIIDNIEITGAVAQRHFITDTGRSRTYAWNAAGLMIQNGDGISIRRCDIHHNETGIFSSRSGELTVEHCYVHENGVHKRSYTEHNLYVNGGAGSRFILQFSHIGEELNDGQQVKSRAETTIVRYNRIEGGRNSILDLVEQGSNGVSDAYVYGNILVKIPPVNNTRIVHFGGDNKSVTREGTLYFFNNTVVSLVGDTSSPGANYAVLFQVDEDKARVIADNNIIYNARKGRIRICDISSLNRVAGTNNWISSNTEQIQCLTNSVLGKDPGFVDYPNGNLFLSSGSAARDIATPYTAPGGHNLSFCYVEHAGCQARSNDGKLDRGALE